MATRSSIATKKAGVKHMRGKETIKKKTNKIKKRPSYKIAGGKSRKK
jgi:hypothetical protein